MLKTKEISVETANAISGIFNKKNLNLDVWVGKFDELAKRYGTTDELAIKFLETTQKSGIVYKNSEEAMAGLQSYLKSTSHSLTLADVKTKALTASMKVLSTVGWMAVFAAASWAVGKAFEAIDDNIHRLENAKETLAETESQLSDVKTEIESTTEKIKELQSLESLSIVDEHDLQTLKDQNEELRIRQQYLEKQKLLDQDKVAEYTKQKYNYEGGSVTDDEIADYRSLYGATAIPSQSKELANLIAQYQYYSEERAKAVTDKDQESIDKWDAKLNKTTQNLMDSRKKLQGWSDSLGDEASPELEGITSDLERIDDLLLSPGQKLTNFINSDSLSDDKTKLIELIKTGKLTEDNLTTNFKEIDAYLKENNLTLKDLISVTKVYKDELADTSNVAENAFAPLSKEEVIANINSLSEGFESLDKIMKSISDKDNPFDYALLDDTKFKDNFDGLGESYTNFIEKISNSPKDINAVQSAFNTLVTEWIDSEGVLNGVTAETSGLSVAMLKNMGVANAEEVVLSQLTSNQEHLAAQKAYTAEMSDALANATANEIPGLIDEATQSDIAKVALAGLALQKANANGTILNTSGDIENAIALINTIGAATTALVAYNKAKAGDIFDSSTQKANLNNLLSQKTGLGLSVEIDKQLKGYQDKMDSLKNAADKEVQDAIKKSSEYKGQGAEVNAIYNGGPKTNKDGGSDKDKKDTSKEFDWIERDLKLLNEEREKALSKASDTSIDYFGLTNEEFNRAKELFNDSTGMVGDKANELANFAKQAGISLSDLYTLIANGNPGESRENYLAQVLELDKSILPRTEQAVESYKKIWEDAASKISPENKAKIEQGYKDVETLPGAEAEGVQTAIDAYDKWQSIQDSYTESQKKNTDAIMAEYDNRINAINKENEQLEKTNSVLESRMDYLKSIGEIPSASLYEDLISNTGTEISNTQKLISELRGKLKEARSKYGKDSEEYINLKTNIDDAEASLYTTMQTQEKYNQLLAQMPIDHLSTIISMYDDITAKIENWGSVQTATGTKLDGEYYQTLISNGTTVIGQYQKQIKEIKSLMSEYKEGSTVWQELYEQLQDIDSATASMLTNLKKWNAELLAMPLDKINTYSDSLQKVISGLTDVQGEYDTVISAVTGAIQNQIDLLNEQGELETENRQSEIDALKEKLELLDKENEYRKLIFDKQQKLYELERARNQRTVKVYREGNETYENDKSAERQAEQNLLDSEYNLEKYNLQEQIDSAQESLDLYNSGLQDQIDALQKISDKWSEINEKIIQGQNEEVASSILGSGWKDKILSGNDTALFNAFSGMYQNTAKQLDEYQKQAESTENIYGLLEDYIASYKDGTITYDQALSKINELLTQLNQSMSATDNLQNIFDYIGTVNGTEANADAVLKGIQSGLKDTATELLKSMEQYNKNSGMISEYTSSWQQLTDNVKSMLDVLKEVRDNLEDSYDRDDDDDDKTSKNGWDDSDADNGPGVKSKTSGGDIFDIISGYDVVERYAKGVENGPVGKSSSSDRDKMIRYLATNDLKKGEVPILAHTGEQILNEQQKMMLLKNFENVQSMMPNVKVPDYTKTLQNVVVKQPEQIINISHGDLSFPNVRNIDDAITEFAQLSEMAIRQELAKR